MRLCKSTLIGRLQNSKQKLNIFQASYCKLAKTCLQSSLQYFKIELTHSLQSQKLQKKLCSDIWAKYVNFAAKYTILYFYIFTNLIDRYYQS